MPVRRGGEQVLPESVDADASGDMALETRWKWVSLARNRVHFFLQMKLGEPLLGSE